MGGGEEENFETQNPEISNFPVIAAHREHSSLNVESFKEPRPDQLRPEKLLCRLSIREKESVHVNIWSRKN